MTDFDFNCLNKDILHVSKLFAASNWAAWKKEYECDGLQALVCSPLDQENDYCSGFEKIYTECKFTKEEIEFTKKEIELNKEEIKALKNSRFNLFMNEYSLSRNFVASTSELKITPHAALKTRMRLKGLIVKVTKEQKEILASVETLQNYLSKKLNCVKIKSHNPDDRDSGTAIKFTSFCSKLLTFYDPSKFTPYDQFARKGLDALKNNKNQPPSALNYSCYKPFLEDFNILAKKCSDQLVEMANNSDIVFCHEDVAKRRILDNYLMIAGGYRGPWLAERALSVT